MLCSNNINNSLYLCEMNFKKCVLWTFSLVFCWTVYRNRCSTWISQQADGQMVKNYVQEKTVMPTCLKSQSRHCSSHHRRMQWGHERMFNWTVALGWGFPSGQPPHSCTHTAIPNPSSSLRVSLSLHLPLMHLRLCSRGLEECWRNAERGPSLVTSPHT